MHGPFVENLCGERPFFFGMLYKTSLFLGRLGLDALKRTCFIVFLAPHLLKRYKLRRYSVVSRAGLLKHQENTPFGHHICSNATLGAWRPGGPFWSILLLSRYVVLDHFWAWRPRGPFWPVLLLSKYVGLDHFGAWRAGGLCRLLCCVPDVRKTPGFALL